MLKLGYHLQKYVFPRMNLDHVPRRKRHMTKESLKNDIKKLYCLRNHFCGCISHLASEMNPPFISCCTGLCVETFGPKWAEASKPCPPFWSKPFRSKPEAFCSKFEAGFCSKPFRSKPCAVLVLCATGAWGGWRGLKAEEVLGSQPAPE